MVSMKKVFVVAGMCLVPALFASQGAAATGPVSESTVDRNTSGGGDTPHPLACKAVGRRCSDQFECCSKTCQPSGGGPWLCR